MDWIIVLFFR